MRTNTNSQNPTRDDADTAIPSTDIATPPLLVTIPEAARILAVSRSTIYELIWHDRLVPVRIGRSVRIRHHDLENFVHEQILAEPTGAPPAPPAHRTTPS